MTIKTPEQIAAEVFKASNWFQVEDRHEFMDAVVAAIEADRAQRRDALDALHDWAVNVSCFMAEDKSNDWSEELAELAEIEREYGLVDDEEPEPTSDDERGKYAKYLDQQFWGDRD